MTRVVNLFFAVLLGAVVTFALFFLMQMLIAGDGEIPERQESVRIGDITMPDQEIEIQREAPRPERPDEIEEIPELPDLNTDIDAPSTEGLSIAGPDISVDIGDGASISATDGEYLPIVTVPPQYPNRALQRGIEGWCQVEFTVNENGGVEDARVVDGEPPGIFDSASLRAVARFRFNPRTQDGSPVKTHGVQYVFTYRLDE